jgi:hypothetical protein
MTGYIGNAFYWFVSQTTSSFSFGLAFFTGGVSAWRQAKMAHDSTPYYFMTVFFLFSFAVSFSWPKASPQIGELRANQANASNAQQASAQAYNANNV